MGRQTPILLLTGYLGSGKTTLLNRILRETRDTRFAVIVNDLGEVNIDAELIQQGGLVSQTDDSLVPLQNGCICCTLKEDLALQLRDISRQGRFDHIIIEASGICEPGPIAQTICAMPQLYPGEEQALPRLDCIATVVDAVRMADEFRGGLDLLKERIADDDLESLVIQQVEFCNIILLNKASDVPPDQLGRITEVLRTLQPRAEILPCDQCGIDLHRIINSRLFDFEATATSAAWVDILEGHDDHANEPEGEADEYGISTYVFHSRRPMSLTRFDHFVARRWPQGVIRAKGMCYFKGEEDTCYLFEQAGKQVSLSNAGQWYATMPPSELQDFLGRNPAVARDWDETYGDRTQKLVFIGQRLNTEYIASELEECLED